MDKKIEMLNVAYSRKFLKSLSKLSKEIQNKAIVKDNIFRTNPFDPRLKTHKLHGKQKEEWSYSIDNFYRVTFIFVKNGEILFLDIGNHDQLYGK